MTAYTFNPVKNSPIKKEKNMAFNTTNIHRSKKLFSGQSYCCCDHLYLSSGSGNTFWVNYSRRFCPFSAVSVQSADLFCFTKAVIASFSSGLTVNVLESRERDLAFPFEVVLGADVHALDEHLLVEQGVVRTQSTGGVVVTLVVVAQVRLPQWRNVLVHVNLVT